MNSHPVPGVFRELIILKVQETRHMGVPVGKVRQFKTAIEQHPLCRSISGPYADQTYAATFHCCGATPEQLEQFLSDQWLNYSEETEWRVLQ